VEEIQVQRPGYNILRRRIAIVIGQWLGVKYDLNQHLVYQIFQYLLDGDDKLNDVVVRVTAGRQLKNVIDGYGFSTELFMPFAATIMGRLVALIEESELSETKLALLNTLSVLVIRLEHHVGITGSSKEMLTPDRSIPLQIKSSTFFLHFGTKQRTSIS
jgi:hypothetical protein